MTFRGTRGKRLLSSLFVETHRGGPEKPLYVLRDHYETPELPSLHRLYIDCEDPTEFFFANQYLESFSHWQMLCNCKWFTPYLTKWREELQLKIKAKAIRKLQELADLDGKEALAASKALLDYEKHLEKMTKKPVGRPKKEDVPEEISVDDIYERIFTKPITQERIN